MRRLPTRLLSLKCLALLLVAAGWLLGTVVQAAEVGDLYQAQVEAAGRTPAQQRQAMALALREVAMKVSGRFDLKNDQLRGLFANVEKMVQSYAFAGGARGEPLRMQVSFDSAAVNAGLQQAGLPVWGSNRPRVLAWLVREENGQRRILSREIDGELLSQVRSLSQKRGLPFELPLNDVQDMEAVSPADLWAGFLDNVKLASERYHPDIIVIGKLHQAGLLWQGDWQIVAVGGTHTQDFNGPDVASVVEPGIAWVTQDIAGVYATAATPAASGGATGDALTFRISGVRTLKDYAAVVAYLKRLVVVKSVATREVGADALALSVGSDTQVETLLQTLKADGRLVEVTPVSAAMPAAVPADATTNAGAAGSALPTGTPPETAGAAPVAPTAPASGVYEFEWHG